jgi:hypothetical protein
MPAGRLLPATDAGFFEQHLDNAHGIWRELDWDRRKVFEALRCDGAISNQEFVLGDLLTLAL